MKRELKYYLIDETAGGVRVTVYATLREAMQEKKRLKREDPGKFIQIDIR